MRLDGVQVENIRCYAEAEVGFEPGVTVIHGVNGSGKSTLLDACFFGLYGAETLDGATLDEIITTGAEAAEVVVRFGHEGTTYELIRELRLQGDRAYTATCELRGPDEIISGARDVRAAVADMLRMDAEAFLNCAYVRQGEVNKLIDASPGERQDMIDELLQLGVLEAYRERAVEARRGIGSIRDELRGQLDAVDEQLAAKDPAELIAQLNELETERAETEAALEELDDRIETAEQVKAEAEQLLEEHTERQEELASLEDEITTIRDAMQSDETEREACTARIAELTEQRQRCEENIATMHADLDLTDRTVEAVEAAREAIEANQQQLQSEIEDERVRTERAEQRAVAAADRAETLRERADTLATEADERDARIESDTDVLDERTAEVEALDAERATIEERLEQAGYGDGGLEAAIEAAEDKIASLTEELAERTTTRDALEASIAEVEDLVEAGKCPTCEQPVHEAPPVSSLEDDHERIAELDTEIATLEADREHAREALSDLRSLREDARERDRLTERIESARALLAEKATAVEELRQDVESRREEATETREAAADAEEDAQTAREEAAAARERIEELRADRDALETEREALDALHDTYGERERLSDAIDTAKERRETLETLLAERHERLAEKRSRRRELAEAVDEARLEHARTQYEKATAAIDDAQTRRDTLADMRDALLDRIGRIQNERDAIERLREQRETIDARQDAIETLHADVVELETMYRSLRSELREQNLVALEGMLNDIFALVYQNDAYDRIELDGDYRFTVYQKDGAPLAPDQLSGGERALFNLSLRCAIYRLLSEGIEGTGPLPPLILDEPTVYLDAGHVGRLVELVETMRGFGVEQIVIVTHDDELLRAADRVLSVEKDPTSNRSRVTVDDVMHQVLAAD